MWSVKLKTVVENLVTQGFRSVKLLSSRNNLTCRVAGESGACLIGGRSSQTVVKCSPNSNSIAACQGASGGGVVNRLRPVTARIVQSLFRKVPAPLWTDARRRATKRLIFGETAPYFALVGVSLVSGSQQGLLTKEDELEALCGNIREAVTRAGWLHDPQFWESLELSSKDLDTPSTSGSVKPSKTEVNQQHIFSLNDLDIGSPIDKGCNAIVYAAKWKEDISISSAISSPDDKFVTSPPSSPPRSSASSSSSSTTPASSTSTLGDIFDTQHQSDLESYPSLQPIWSLSDEIKYYSDIDFLEDCNHENLLQSSRHYHSELNLSPATAMRRPTTSISEDFARLVPNGSPEQKKRVKFKVSDDKENSTKEKYHQNASKRFAKMQNGQPTKCRSSKEEYPLAVKMMFNYEAASNAPAILAAMYKELIPARDFQLNQQEGFFGGRIQLPSHPNVVDMPCAFIDRVQFLEGSMELCPLALPTRLNPDGAGRNMSLFCVMKRYDVSLKDYLTHHKVAPHTALLLITQLLEAILHINNNKIVHRDLKCDNILLSLYEGWDYPLLVLSDFGCCLADPTLNMSVPFISSEAEPRQGNTALMAPEVKCAVPGFLKYVNFSRSDLWAVGTIIYEIFGQSNPFLSGNIYDRNNEASSLCLDSATFKESQLPRLSKSAPAPIRRLVQDLLRRNPKNRPSPVVAATLCQLLLWAPSKWLCRHALTLPSQTEVTQWLLCLTTKVLCEARMSNEDEDTREGSNRSGLGGQLEYDIVSTFLSRVHYNHIIQAIKWNRAF